MSTSSHQNEDEYESEDAFWRKLVLPQEERMRLGIPWHGGYRWFQSENIIPIEQVRRKRRQAGPTNAPKPAA
jgi:hypothetical protein